MTDAWASEQKDKNSVKNTYGALWVRRMLVYACVDYRA